MDVLTLLADGMLLALEPLNFALIIIGVSVGLFIGAMPGLGSVNGVAILLPVTFLVPPSGAIIFLAAIYYGAMYGETKSPVEASLIGRSIMDAIGGGSLEKKKAPRLTFFKYFIFLMTVRNLKKLLLLSLKDQPLMLVIFIPYVTINSKFSTVNL